MQLKPNTEVAYQKYKAINKDDPYGKCIVDFSELWATLMEEEISNGKTIKEIAKTTYSKADRMPGYGITGFMYGCVIAGLSKFWIHGEELRKWHNLDVQIHDEGEKANKEGCILNPTLMTVTAPAQD